MAPHQHDACGHCCWQLEGWDNSGSHCDAQQGLHNPLAQCSCSEQLQRQAA